MRPHWLREADHRDKQARWSQAREEVARGGLFLAFVLSSPMLFVTFAPCPPSPLLATAALLFSLGFVSAKWSMKLQALALTILFALWAWTNWHIEAEYERRLQAPRGEFRSSDAPATGLARTSSPAPRR